MVGSYACQYGHSAQLAHSARIHVWPSTACNAPKEIVATGALRSCIHALRNGLVHTHMAPEQNAALQVLTASIRVPQLVGGLHACAVQPADNGAAKRLDQLTRATNAVKQIHSHYAKTHSRCHPFVDLQAAVVPMPPDCPAPGPHSGGPGGPVEHSFIGDLRSRAVTMSLLQRWVALVQCTCALQAAHSSGIAHCNLYAGHVFVRTDASIAVCGWDSADLTAACCPLSSLRPPQSDSVFTAPEVSPAEDMSSEYGCSIHDMLQADVWSLGMIALLLALPETWRAVVDAADGPGLPRLQAAQEKRERMRKIAAASVLDSHMKSFLDASLRTNPGQRGTTEDLVKIAIEGLIATNERVELELQHFGVAPGIDMPCEIAMRDADLNAAAEVRRNNEAAAAAAVASRRVVVPHVATAAAQVRPRLCAPLCTGSSACVHVCLSADARSGCICRSASATLPICCTAGSFHAKQMLQGLLNSSAEANAAPPPLTNTPRPLKKRPQAETSPPSAQSDATVQPGCGDFAPATCHTAQKCPAPAPMHLGPVAHAPARAVLHAAKAAAFTGPSPRAGTALLCGSAL